MSRALAVSLCAVLFVTTLGVVSQEASAAPSRRALRKAKRLYRQGQRLYKKGQFAEAAKRFETCYSHDPRAAFLINAAQAHRGAKNLARAIALYRKFLEVAPKAKLRDQVETLIRDLEAALPQPKPPVEPTSKPTPAFVKPLPPKPQPEQTASSSPFYKKWWFWTVVGVAVVGTATGVGIAAASGGDDYVKEGGLGAVRW